MLTKSILTTSAIVLVAGLGSASAGEKFNLLEGIDAQVLDSNELASVTASHIIYYARDGDGGVFLTGRTSVMYKNFSFPHGTVCQRHGMPASSLLTSDVHNILSSDCF